MVFVKEVEMGCREGGEGVQDLGRERIWGECRWRGRSRDRDLVSGRLSGPLLTLAIVHSSTPNHSQQGGCVSACVRVSLSTSHVCMTTYL